MMCNPCFMDANQVGYVHEPTFEDTKAILDRAVSFKPKRQIIILFSGGEPTLSPYYLDAVAYARKIGFYRILPRPTESVLPKTSSFANRRKPPASTASICSSTEWVKRRINTAASGTFST